ncbi:enoyl-CoA delta isomerase 2, mitochondrial [Drosophila innubila]|uniref:enoyl-CoA delta isomerase 2, mitochondrial n=1 Tax=Drosophila innubila TaxID=198719 RepID=UPI00148CD9D8|nr:enoyl-CoA delta isomerase 2, mitochondrial [Drosophila innubila]
MSYLNFDHLIVQKEGKILVIKFYNPAKKNCLNRFAYQELTRALTEVNNDEEITIVVITGVGEYFTAGNELSLASQVPDFGALLKESNDIFKSMISSFINCTKLIFTLVNGPSIGIGTTIVGLSDVAWCAEEAHFLTPFSKLGLVPEACSSYTFPLIMGRSKATEMLLLNEKLSAQEAYHFNFVSRVFKLSELDSVVWPKIREYAELPPHSIKESKRLINVSLRENLIRANDEECAELLNRMYDDEFVQAMVKFLNRKSKL